jgi:ABC-type multidrug transport system ATPase subunit
MPVRDLSDWLDQMQLSTYDREMAARILIELRQRIDTLLAVGLGYLTLHRPANTLSGGESQRIQLTRMLGSNLTDSLYILDEPSIGLHPRDTGQLINVLKKQHVDHHVLVRTEKLMSDGILLNDPNIPKKYVEKYGILIDKDHAETLRFIMEREAIEADELEYTFS